MRFALLLITTLAVGACSPTGKREDSKSMPPPPVKAEQTPGSATSADPQVFVSSSKGEVRVNVEVVATPAKITKGLMFRQHLPLDGGMLFLMGEERVHTFWMRNTLIALDMLFITRDFTVAGIVENAAPLTEELRTVGKPSLYVLEVNGGWAKANGVVAGAQVRFENVSR